jgi:dihydrofolate reductase
VDRLLGPGPAVPPPRLRAHASPPRGARTRRGTTFHFVTDGIESALEQARAAAGESDVSLGGGASVVQQYLVAGLLDEMLISVVPVCLGGGTRLFDDLGDVRPMLEQVQSVEAPGVTHIRYRLA